MIIGGQGLTWAGNVHFIYMSLMLAVFILFYFSTTDIKPELLVATSALLVFHMILGTHIPLGIWCPEWYGRRPDMASFITVGTTAALITWRTIAILKTAPS